MYTLANAGKIESKVAYGQYNVDTQFNTYKIHL